MAETEGNTRATKEITIIVRPLHRALQLAQRRRNMTMLKPHCHDLQRQFRNYCILLHVAFLSL